MSTAGSYPVSAFSETKTFLVYDPSSQTTQRVLGSDLVNYITPNLNYVRTNTTRSAAQTVDYNIGIFVQVAGGTAIGDGASSMLLVVAAGEGDYAMNNGNELLVLPRGSLAGSDLDGALVTDNGVQREIQVALSDRPVQFESFESIKNEDLSGYDSVETVGFYTGWAATLAGPKGGATYYRDGTTGTASTAYADNSGFYDANGDGFKLDQLYLRNVLCYGAYADGTNAATTTTAFANMLSNLTDSCEVVFPEGNTYALTTGSLGIDLSNVTFRAFGVDFITASSSGILFNLNQSATSGDDNANIQRNVKWFGGRFLNSNGTNSATNNTAIAISIWAVRDFTVQHVRFGSGDDDYSGHGWNKGIDASGFDAIKINFNYFYRNDHHIYFGDVYTDTVLQNITIYDNNLTTAFAQQIYADTAVADFKVLYNDTAQPNDGLVYLKTGNGSDAGDTLSSSGIRIIGNNTEQLQTTTKNLIEIAYDSKHTVSDVTIVDNTLVGDNNNIVIGQSSGTIKIADNTFLTAEATAITATAVTGTLIVTDNKFAQTGTDSGTIIDAQFSGSGYHVVWGNDDVSKSDLGAITWSHVDTQPIRDRFRSTDTPVIFGTKRNGGDTNVTTANMQSTTSLTGQSTGTTDLAPLTDIGNTGLFAHNNDASLISAVLVKVTARDSGSAAGSPLVRVYPDSATATAASAIDIYLGGVTNDVYRTQTAWVALGDNNEITVDVTASGAGTCDVVVYYLGFF